MSCCATVPINVLRPAQECGGGKERALRVVLAAESTSVFTSMNVLRTHSTFCTLGESHGKNEHCEGVWGDDSGVWQTDERGEESSPFATVLRSLIGVIASSTCLKWASFRWLSPPRDGRRESCKKSVNARHSDLARFKLAQACSAATAARSSVGTSVVVLDGLASNVTAKIFAKCRIISPSVSAPAAAARLSADTTFASVCCHVDGNIDRNSGDSPRSSSIL